MAAVGDIRIAVRIRCSDYADVDSYSFLDRYPQRIELTKPKLLEYFPPFYTKPQMENVIFSLLEQWKRENEKEST